MADEEKEIHIQVNAAKSQRNANRDYHEVRAPQSVGLYLAVTPQAEIDTLTLDNAMARARRRHRRSSSLPHQFRRLKS